MRAETPERQPPANLLLNRNFWLLAAGYFISAVGDNMNDPALLKARDALTGDDSVRVAALLLLGLFLPYLLVGPLAGWWADRYSRRVTMIVADVCRALLVFNFGAIIATLERANFGHYSVMVPQLSLGLFAAFFSPARQALLPTLVRRDQLVRANGLVGALAPMGAILGFAVGGVIVEYFGVGLNFNINTLTYATSALCLLLVIVPKHARPAGQSPQRGVWRPLLQGIAYVRSHRRVAQMIGLGALFWGTAGVVYACVPAIVARVVSDSYADMGLYRGLPAIGLAVGAGAMSIAGPALHVRSAVLLGLALSGGWLLLLTLTHALLLGPLVAAICLMGVGLGGALLLVTIFATLQRFVPDAFRGRVFGVSDMATMGAMVVAAAALGLPKIPNMDAFVPWLLGGAALLLLGTLVYAYRLYRRTDPMAPVLSVLFRFFSFYAKFWLRLRRVGPCTVPRQGPVILAANHTAGVDPIAMITSCPYRVPSFLVEEKYYRVPGAKWLMDQVSCVPIDRENPNKSFMTGCLRLLKDGGILGIFPQGTYEPPDQPLPPPKPGVGVLALRTQATVIPCHISGTRYFYNPFRAYFARHDVRVRFGPPVDLSDFAGREKDKDAPQAATDRIMDAIWRLAPDAEATRPSSYGGPGCAAS